MIVRRMKIIINTLYIEITVPLSICEHFTNAFSFYSKFDKTKAFPNAVEYDLKLLIKYNDEWIIKHFDGPLNPNYQSVTATLV